MDTFSAALVVTGAAVARAAELEHRNVKLPERLNQPESRCLVIGQRVSANNVATIGCQPDCFGLGYQVADRQYQPVLTDDDTITYAFGTQNRCRERIFGNLGPHRYHRVEDRIQFETDVIGIRLQTFRKRPFFRVRHTQMPGLNFEYCLRELPDLNSASTVCMQNFTRLYRVSLYRVSL